MTPLRQRMTEDMQLRNLAPATQVNYIHHVADFAKYFNTSPEYLDLEDLRQYMLHLVNDRKLSPESINQFVTASQFLYLTTLEMPWGDELFPRVRRPHKLPIVLSHEEVVQFFDYIPSLKYRAVLMSCYGAGLHISEAVKRKVSDIDSQRMLIRGEQGKPRKDRYAMLSPRLLEVLRVWWRARRPEYWLFPGWRTGRPITATAMQVACRAAALACGLRKRITPHMRAIETCRTAALGGHVEQCDQHDTCAPIRVSYNSCSNRHGPKCGSLARAEWLEQRKRRSCCRSSFPRGLHRAGGDRRHRLLQ